LPARAKVHLVYRRIAHHARTSGYDRLAAYLPEAEAITGDRLGPVARKLGLLTYHNLLVRQGEPVRHYGGEQFLVELAALPRRVLTRERRIFHLLYGDTQLWLTSRLRGRRNRVVATFHDPPEGLRTWVAPRRLRGLDAAICLGDTQAAFLREHLPEEQVHVVPHGVDSSYFSPGDPPGAGAPPRVVSVGHYLRDVELLRDAFTELRRREGDHLDLVAVASPEALAPLSGVPGLRQLSGLGADELRELYRGATATLLPLRAATANNALLEGLSCGAPSVVSDVGDVRSYTGEDAALLVPAGDLEATVAAVQRLLGDPELRATLSAAGRARALELDWLHVAERTRAVYRSLED
jgi:glycosyltransferase involved in cell wall biosynthesis